MDRLEVEKSNIVGYFGSESPQLNFSLCFRCSNGNIGLHYECQPWHLAQGQVRLECYFYQCALGRNDPRHLEMSRLILDIIKQAQKTRSSVIKYKLNCLKPLVSNWEYTRVGSVTGPNKAGQFDAYIYLRQEKCEGAQFLPI